MWTPLLSPPLPSYPSTPLSSNPPQSFFPPPLTPILPTLWARRALWGRLYSVTFLTHWFFCALSDLLSRLPQPAKRGKIIHQRPLRWETIYRPPTQSHRSTNTHTYEHTQKYSMQERRRPVCKKKNNKTACSQFLKILKRGQT